MHQDGHKCIQMQKIAHTFTSPKKIALEPVNSSLLHAAKAEGACLTRKKKTDYVAEVISPSNTIST
jgi:hypothetical protein